MRRAPIPRWTELTDALALSFARLALFGAEMVWRLSPLLDDVGYAIWAIFLLEFALAFPDAIAPALFLCAST